MPYKLKEKQLEYIREYKKRKRRERGLKKRGRLPNTSEQSLLSKQKTSSRQKIWKKNYFEYRPEKRLLWAARSRAKRKGIPCTITEADIIIPTVCPYLDIPLRTGSKLGENRSDVLSLDRIVPALGYVPGNIEVISQLANNMKNSASRDQLLFFAKRVLEKYT